MNCLTSADSEWTGTVYRSVACTYNGQNQMFTAVLDHVRQNAVSQWIKLFAVRMQDDVCILTIE